MSSGVGPNSWGEGVSLYLVSDLSSGSFTTKTPYGVDGVAVGIWN